MKKSKSKKYIQGKVMLEEVNSLPKGNTEVKADGVIYPYRRKKESSLNDIRDITSMMEYKINRKTTGAMKYGIERHISKAHVLRFNLFDNSVVANLIAGNSSIVIADMVYINPTSYKCSKFFS